MLEMIRKNLLRLYQMKRVGISEYVRKWYPKILEKLEECRKKAGNCIVTYVGE
jgi:hypothetical protein